MSKVARVTLISCYTVKELRMANVTLAIDEQVLRRARIRALEQGTSVNALIREYLESFAGNVPAHEGIAAFLELASR